MSEPPPHDDEPLPNGSPPDLVSKAGVRIRIWPAVLIVLAHISVTLSVIRFASTNNQNLIGLAVAPGVAALLLAVWWLGASRAPWRDRFVGLIVFAAALGVVVISQTANGAMLLMAAMPAMTTGVVLVLAVTPWVRWRVRRWVTVAFIVGCAGVFCATRLDTLSGSLVPILSWRWSPTPEELLSETAPFPRAGANRIAHLPAQAGPGDWPGFRGPDRDDRVTGVTFSTHWNPAPREVWRRRIGLGWSSFCAVGDYLFTQEQRGKDELVTCYRASDGKEVWVNSIHARFEDAMGSGPRATPTFDHGKLFTFGATGVLQCLDASTGKTLWKNDVTSESGVSTPSWGFASSPLVVGDLVLVFTGGAEGKSVAAFNTATGKPAWRAGHATTGYSSPELTRIAGVPQVLVTSNFGIQSFVPETGQTLWEHAWKATSNPRVVQPLLTGNGTVLIGTAGGQGTRSLRVEKQNGSWTVKQQWTTRRFRPYFNDCVYDKGFCYGFDGNRFDCLDVATGQLRWEGNRVGGQVLLIVDMDTLLLLTERGDVVLIQATPNRYHEIARFQALHGKTWNHPVIAHGKLYVRNSAEAACYDLANSSN